MRLAMTDIGRQPGSGVLERDQIIGNEADGLCFSVRARFPAGMRASSVSQQPGTTAVR